MTDAPVTAGRPTDALQRARIASWSYGQLVPRHNYINYRAREGRTNLETLRLIRDRDPDASHALMNEMLLIGQGYQTEARNGDTVDDQATAYLRALDARVGAEYGGGMDMLVDVLTLTQFTQGAQALEIQIADDLTEVVDFHPIDPARITAKREQATQRLMWGMQVGRGAIGVDSEGFLEFNPRQFRYMPLHPDVDDPYGRSPILSALTAIFFKIQVLEDLRAVVHNQGYPRIDAKIVEEVVKNALGPHATPDAIQEQMSKLQTGLGASLSALNPDDALIHPDSVEFDYLKPGGTAIDIKALDAILDKQIISGLKQLPVLLGRNEGATTTHATIQWKIHTLMIEALRRRTKRLIEWAHTTALQVAGFQCTAHVSFDALQTNDALIDAQALETKVRTWETLITLGLADRNEAAQDVLGHPAVAEREPVKEV